MHHFKLYYKNKCSYTWKYSHTTPIKTSYVYRLHEVWPGTCSKVRIYSSFNPLIRIKIHKYHYGWEQNILLLMHVVTTSFTEESGTMNQNIGNLEIPEINISDMPPDRFMPFQRIWQHTFLLTSKYFLQFLGYFSYHWYKLTGTKMAMQQVFLSFGKLLSVIENFIKGI